MAILKRSQFSVRLEREVFFSLIQQALIINFYHVHVYVRWVSIGGRNLLNSGRSGAGT